LLVTPQASTEAAGLAKLLASTIDGEHLAVEQ